MDTRDAGGRSSIMIKSAVKLIYSNYLRRKWNMSSQGASMLVSSFINDYRRQPFFLSKKAHKHGYCVNDFLFVKSLGNDISPYINNAEYYGLHPINQEFSHWIDDKLTLAFLLRGTEMESYLPEYYYHITSTGEFLKIGLSENLDNNVADVLTLLKEKGILAIKRISGSIGEGFYRFEYVDGQFFINGTENTTDDVLLMLGSLRNYLIMEFLRPCKAFAEYCSKTSNTIRYLVGRIDGKLQFLFGYLRIGSLRANVVENYNAGGVLCIFDENGKYEIGHIFDFIEQKDITIKNHPDTGAPLSGIIPQIEEIKKATESLSHILPELQYCGIDYVIDENNNVKILEINSLNSLDGINLEIAHGNQMIVNYLKSIQQ